MEEAFDITPLTLYSFADIYSFTFTANIYSGLLFACVFNKQNLFEMAALFSFNLEDNRRQAVDWSFSYRPSSGAKAKYAFSFRFRSF